MSTNKTTLATYLLSGLAILVGLSGCAAVDQKIGLNYVRQNTSLVKHSGEITVSRVESKPFAKNVAGEWIIGSLNNVYGVHQADLLSDRSLSEWISEAVLHELKLVGYTVSTAPTLPVSAVHGIIISDIDMTFQINKGVFSTDTRQELKFNVSVFSNGIKSKTFYVASRDDRTVPLVATKEDTEKILLHSLQDAMLQIIPDIIVLIDKK